MGPTSYVHRNFRATRVQFQNSVPRRGEEEMRGIFSDSGSSPPSRAIQRSGKFTVYLNRSRAYVEAARENLRSRSPDGRV